MSQALCIAIAKTIRGAGYCVGWTRMEDGDFVANAVDGRTLESFTVTCPSEQAAWIELARQVGIELED